MRKPKKAKARKAVAKKRKATVRPFKRPFAKTLTKDCYEIPPSKRASNVDYCWIAVSILGEPVDRRVIDAQIDTGGWQPCPMSRHRDVFKYSESNEWIIMDGLQLYWRQARNDGLTEANKAAIKMEREHPAFAGQSMHSSVRSSTDRRSHTAAFATIEPSSEPYERVRPDAEDVVVDLTIPFRLNADLQDTANALRLPAQEYAQRRITLYLRNEIAGLLVPSDGAFDLRQFYLNEHQRT